MSYRDWQPSSAAAAELGLNRRQLIRLRDLGDLKLGTHYRIASSKGVIRKTYIWNVREIGKLFSTPPEKR